MWSNALYDRSRNGYHNPVYFVVVPVAPVTCKQTSNDIDQMNHEPLECTYQAATLGAQLAFFIVIGRVCYRVCRIRNDTCIIFRI